MAEGSSWYETDVVQLEADDVPVAIVFSVIRVWEQDFDGESITQREVVHQHRWDVADA